MDTIEWLAFDGVTLPRFLEGGPQPKEEEPGPDDDERIPYGVMEYETLFGTVTLTYDTYAHTHCFYSALLPMQPPTPRNARVVRPLGPMLGQVPQQKSRYATHCKRGHPLTPENVYADKTNHKRRCKLCYCQAQAERRRHAHEVER